MAQNGISRQGQGAAATPLDPAPMTHHFVAILALALCFSLLGSITLAAERGTPEQRRACTPDVFRYCGEFIPDPDRITGCLRRKASDISPECRIVMAGERKS